MERQGKGIERGMEIVMTPRLCTKQLNGGIKRGGNGNEYAQCRGDRRINIVEMDDICPAAQQSAHSVCTAHNDTEGKEYQQVNIGKDVDKLRDGVVG